MCLRVSFSPQARLSRFQGATAISSADFYDNGEGPSGGGGSSSASTDFDVSANELMSKLSFQVRDIPSSQCTEMHRAQWTCL
jgi:hypothetical protein